MLIGTRKRKSKTASSVTVEDAAVPQFAPIHVAAMVGDISKLEAILDEDPSQLELMYLPGATPLYYALSSETPEAFRFLLSRGANPFVQDDLQQDLVSAAKDSPFLEEVKKVCGLSKAKLAHLEELFELLIKGEARQAKIQNKAMLLILGETHYIYKILQVEELILNIAKRTGINIVLGEFNPAEGLEYPSDLYAKDKLHMNVIGIDIALKPATVPQRNMVMTKEILRVQQGAVLRIGSDHLKGILEPHLLSDVKQLHACFHIVPFNLSKLYEASLEFPSSDTLFAFDSQKVIQVDQHLLSDPAPVLIRCNAPGAVVVSNIEETTKSRPSSSTKKSRKR